VRNDYEPSKLGALGSLALVSGLIGLLVGFVVFPVFGGLGLAAKAAATSFENLPSELKTPPLPQRSTILAANGAYVASFYSENRIQVSLGNVPDVTRKAVVAIEDSRFYEHRGVDVRGIIRAAVRNSEAGQTTQGASTLTQQYVKRVLLEQAVQNGDTQGAQAAVAKSKERKLREIRYALALEQRLSKDQILERYLNIAYFGAGAYGLGTASQVYFKKPVTKLTLAESALLAGLLQSPSQYDPFRNKGIDAVNRRNVVLDRMAQLGFVTAAQAEQAEAEKLVLHKSQVPNGCAGAGIYGHFCDYVRRYILDSPKFGATREIRQARLFRGGLVIRTTVDPRMQALAMAAEKPTFPVGSRYAGGLIVVEPGSGRVKAMAVSRPFTTDQNPYLDARGFQTGSTAKAFVLTAALLKGLPLTYPINSPHHYASKVLTDYKKGVKVPYAIDNDSPGMVGVYDMRSGIAASVNTYYVQLEERVGVDNAVRAALALGVSDPVIDTRTGKKEFDDYLRYPTGFGSFTLGAASITPLDMANAYATLAAHGVRCTPTPIESVTDADGHRLPVGGRSCRKVIDSGVADAATEALSWVVTPKGPVTNGNTGGGAAIGRPVAGKTGTTQDIKEAWFVGYLPQLSAASFVFDPKHQVTLPGGDHSNRIAVNAWARFMKQAVVGLPVVNFPTVQARFLKATGIPVPDVTGMNYLQAAARLQAAGFAVQVSAQLVYAAPIGLGQVASTTPPAGTTLPPGSMITMFVSNGQPPPGGAPSPPPGQPSPPPIQHSPPPLPPPRHCKPPSPFCR